MKNKSIKKYVSSIRKYVLSTKKYKKVKVKKAEILAAILVFCGFLAGAINMSFSAFATYYKDNAKNAKALQQIEMYYKAADRCLGSSKWQDLTIELSSRSEYNNENAWYYYNLNSDKLFEDGHGSNNSNMLYSELLETKTQKGHNDGKIYCSEISIFPVLMQTLNIYYTDNIDKLICNGKEPGIMKVTAGYGKGAARFTAKYDNDNDGVLDWPAGWPDPENGADCGGNLALLLDYIRNRPNETIQGSGNKNHDYAFNVKFELADDAVDYFEDYMRPYLGRRSELNDNEKRAIEYWNYYYTFDLACAKVQSGQTNKPATSTTNMIGIYDAESGQIYYHSTSQIHGDDKQYLDVDTSYQETCKQIAEELGADIDDGGVNARKVKKLALAVGQSKIQGCVDEYFDVREQYNEYWGDYLRIQNAAENVTRLFGNMLHGVENQTKILDGLYRNDQDASEQYNNSLNEFLAIIYAGIDGQAVMANNVFQALKTASDDILSKTTVEFDGTITDTEVTEDELNSAKTIQGQAQSEVDRVGEIIPQMTAILQEYPSGPYTDLEELEGTVWDFDEENLTFTCPGKTGIVNAFNALDLVNPPDIDASYDPGNYEPPDGGNPGGGTDSDDTDPCYRSGEALGWILCPVMSGLTKLSEKAYSWIESNFLQIRATIFSDDANGVEDAWSAMRNIANVLFIIIFLMVIISQLTGYGIDNYGIKKLLPKLIVGAVIMNLSYIVCELAIDASNIFGTGLKSMLEGMGPSLSPAASSYAPSGGQYAIVYGGGIVAAAIGMILSYGGLGAVMMIIVALIACVAAVLMLFVVLIIRQAGVVVCVIVAPVAVLCRLLSNTEKVYKRWFDLMKGFLVVYPICGLVVGAGDLVARIFGNLAGGAGDALQVGFALSAMLVQVLPYFFIPTLLRGSLAAMGNVGAKIQGLGRGLSNRAGRAIKGSDAMKASRMRANDQRVMRKAGVNAKTGELNWRGRARAGFANTGFGKAIGAQRLQAARVSAAKEIRGKNIGAEAALVGAVATSAMQRAGQTPEQYYEAQLEKAADSGNLTAYETAIEAALASGQLKDKDVAAMNRRQIGKLQSTVGDDGTRQNFYRKMAAKYGNGFLATDTEQRAWLQNSGQLKVGRTRTNFTLSTTANGSYAAAGGMEPSDIKLGDVQKMSGDDMAAMIEQGVLSQGLATEARKHGGLSDDKKVMLALHENNLIPTGMTAAQIKSLSGDLTNPKNATKYTAALARLGVTQDQVKMWTSPMPEDVILRDVAIRNEKDGSDQQTHDLYVREDKSPIAPNPAPGGRIHGPPTPPLPPPVSGGGP